MHNPEYRSMIDIKEALWEALPIYESIYLVAYGIVDHASVLRNDGCVVVYIIDDYAPRDITALIADITALPYSGAGSLDLHGDLEEIGERITRALECALGYERDALSWRWL